jgi:hypothetical protein
VASFQVRDVCYSSPLAAAQAAAASQIGSVVQLGNSAYVVDVTGVSASSITYRLDNLASTAFISKVSPFTPLPCGLLDTTDGLVIAWGIAAAWLCTAGVLFLRKGMNV